MTRKEFKDTPERKWDEVLHGVVGVWAMPNGKKHDSGWGCMDFVAEFEDNRPNVKFGGGAVMWSSLSGIAPVTVSVCFVWTATINHGLYIFGATYLFRYPQI